MEIEMEKEKEEAREVLKWIIHNGIMANSKGDKEKVLDLALAQIKEELIKNIEKESEDLDRTCREFLPYSVEEYIPELVKALKDQIQQVIEKEFN